MDEETLCADEDVIKVEPVDNYEQSEENTILNGKEDPSEIVGIDCLPSTAPFSPEELQCYEEWAQKTADEFSWTSNADAPRNLHRFKCNLCLGTFASKYYLAKHVKKHENPQIIQCLTCNLNFKTQEDLTKHYEKIHAKNNTHKCTLCLETFTHEKYLRKHTASMHDIQKVQINSDGKCKKSNQPTPEKSNPLMCILCKVVFSNTGALNKHFQMVHLQIRPFICDICSSSFTIKQNLEIHIEHVHFKFRPFQCPLCLTRFSSKSAEKRHVRAVHEKMKPFHCTFCGSTFSLKHQLKQHLKMVHLQPC